MRILHCLGWVASGGVEQLRLLMAQHLSGDNFEHHIICQEVSGGLPEQFADLGWSIDTVGLARHIFDPSWHRRAIAIARSFAPDIVHGAVYEGEALACSIGLALPRTKVVMEETSSPTNRRWTGNLLMRAMLTRANVAVAVSPAVGDYLTGTLRVSPRKVRVIDNAVGEQQPPKQAEIDRLRIDLGIEPDDLVIGTVSRVLDSHKRISDLIRALALLRANSINARLLVVGDGPDCTALEHLATELDVGDACIWAGYQSSPAAFYRVMDVFALASAYEAFGIVLVEAMMAGCPVVATAVGGIPYVLGHGTAGVLVPPLQPTTLATALHRLLLDPHARSRLGDAGYERARKHFSAERYIGDIRDLYEDLTGPALSGGQRGRGQKATDALMQLAPPKSRPTGPR